MSSNCDNQSTTSLNLNYNRGGIITDAERKTEALTQQVEFEMEQKHKSGEPLGICPKCGAKVMPSQKACKAMNQIFHSSCFVCCECGRTLLGKTFYPVGERVYCEEDFQYAGHMKSLEKCAACSQPIFNMILPAMGKSYHPKCFKCCICGQCLDGVPFTIDRKNNIYCVKDYHNIHSPKCAACGKSISPIDGTGETVRVVSMDKDYHVDCYCCEDCGLQLTDEEPSRAYPLDDHLLCQKCHINRLTTMKQL